jgi:uncharacterized protein (DUF952 family)
MLYHIAIQKEWEQAQTNGAYAPTAYAAEGFIHACKEEQIEGVLQRHFKNMDGLIILHIDEKRLSVPHTFVFVPAVGDEFPHIFGTINCNAVVHTTIIED